MSLKPLPPSCAAGRGLMVGRQFLSFSTLTGKLAMDEGFRVPPYTMEETNRGAEPAFAGVERKRENMRSSQRLRLETLPGISVVQSKPRVFSERSRNQMASSRAPSPSCVPIHLPKHAPGHYRSPSKGHANRLSFLCNAVTAHCPTQKCGGY
jgi:hypothetical protein